MPETAEVTELRQLQQAIAGLRASVDALRGRYGDIPAVKRLAGDVDRLDIDAADLGTVPASAAGSAPADLTAMTPISDEPLDPALWADADDEGLGGYHRQPSARREIHGTSR